MAKSSIAIPADLAKVSSGSTEPEARLTMSERELELLLSLISKTTRDGTRTADEARRFLRNGGLLKEDGTLPDELRGAPAIG